LSRDTSSFTVQRRLNGTSDGSSDHKPDVSEATTSKLSYARDFYLNSDKLEKTEVSEDFVNEVWQDFSGFKNSNDYVVLKQNNGHYDGSLFAMKLAKRGNKKYREQKKRRIRGLLEGLKTDEVKLDFSDKDYTKALFVTFTHNDEVPIKSAWQNISEKYNEVITSLRQKYGKISVFRVFEAYKSGYPHIHAIMLFHDEKFGTFEHDGKTRIQRKNEFEATCNYHSFIDVKGVDNLAKSITYLSKYFTKDSVDIADNPEDLRKAKLTLAFNWLFRRRSFAVSEDFKEKIREFIHTKSNSNNFTSRLQLFRFLEGVSFEFVSLNDAEFLEIDRYENFVPLDDRIKAKIDFEGECQ